MILLKTDAQVKQNYVMPYLTENYMVLFNFGNWMSKTGYVTINSMVPNGFKVSELHNVLTSVSKVYSS